MKKFVFLFLVTLLHGSFCFGEESIKFKAFTERLIKIMDKVTDVTVVTSDPNTGFVVQISDTTIAYIDKNEYTTDDKKQVNLVVYGKNYGRAMITAISGADTAMRPVIVVPEKYDEKNFMLVLDFIDSLRNELMIQSQKNLSSVSEPFQPFHRSDLSFIEYAKAYKSQIFYILIAVFALICFLYILFIHSKQVAKRQKIISQIDIDELKRQIEWMRSEKNKMEIRINNLSSENKKLTEKLRNITDQNQQQQIVYKEQQTQPITPQYLYADFIIDGKFNQVKEQPDDDTTFVLKLNKPGGMRAMVTIYQEAYNRIIANPSFLEGCEKQLLGGTMVSMQRDGVAQKDSNSKWIITTTPAVKIS